ncbi:MAG: ferredoxin [Candidatus Omnitrophica bacterium CG11_big_fil_rev_8_21_14_0_20_42_13]|uniref:Ferredoxin n=1 Tax=Candidatus Ghiorseimicrobium undicola TaxID=1974746 RepID=A0A2H0LXV0_9BACT|nr:MAG: ferredoxin [Candidatus Omnitrophica bacterium CG11_big_fil_rev_8_21_14_0_20_42_13]
MAKKVVKLTFTGEAIKKPLTFRMAKKFDVMPNIRRAKVTDQIGEIVLELDGKEENLEKGIKFLVKSGVIVEPIVGDIVE